MNLSPEVTILLLGCRRYPCHDMLLELLHDMLLEVLLHVRVLQFRRLVEGISRELLVDVPDVPALEPLEVFAEGFVHLTVVVKQVAHVGVSYIMKVLERQQSIVWAWSRFVFLDQLEEAAVGGAGFAVGRVKEESSLVPIYIR